MQIHDELVFEVPHDETDVMEKLIKTEMEQVVKLSTFEGEPRKGT